MATHRDDTELEDHPLDDIPSSQHLLSFPHQQNGHLPAPNGANPHPTSSSSSKPGSIAHLDGLRGVAAFMVYMAHWVAYWCGDEKRANITHGFGYRGGNYPFTALPFVRTFFTGGNPAVAIFFVLSGYVLSRGPLRQMRDGAMAREGVLKGLLGAAVRRPIRLFWPVVACTFLFATVVMHAPFGLAPTLHWPAPEASLWQEIWKWAKETAIVLNPFVDSGPFGRWYAYDPPVWTIAVEFKGSVVVFAFLAALCYTPARWHVLLIVGTSLAFLAVYEWAMSMFIGGLLLVYNDLHFLDGVVARRLSKRAQSTLYHILFFAGWYFLSQPTGMGDPEIALSTPGWYLLTSLTPPNYLTGNHKYWRFWEAPGAFLFVYGVLRINWLQALLGSRPLRFLGRVSFSFYLSHILILWTVGDRICRFFGKVITNDDPMWYDNIFPLPKVGPVGLEFGFIFTQVLIVLPLNLLVAEVGTRLLDEPSVKMGRWVVERIPGLAKNRQAR